MFAKAGGHLEALPPPKFGPVALVDAATVAIDCSQGNFFTLLTTSGVGASRNLGTPTNMVVGVPYYLRVTAHAAADLHTYFGTGTGAAPWCPQGAVFPDQCGIASAKDLFAFVYDGTNIWVSLAVPDGRAA